jgi:hypothetical protein
MSLAMIGDAVLLERVDVKDELLLLAEAREEALAALRELREAGELSFTAKDLWSRPGYWLGRLEGTVIGLVAASDMLADKLG